MTRTRCGAVQGETVGQQRLLGHSPVGHFWGYAFAFGWCLSLGYELIMILHLLVQKQ